MKKSSRGRRHSRAAFGVGQLVVVVQITHACGCCPLRRAFGRRKSDLAPPGFFFLLFSSLFPYHRSAAGWKKETPPQDDARRPLAKHFVFFFFFQQHPHHHHPQQQQQHPVTWQPNTDGTKMIGRMVLTKIMTGGQAPGGGGGPGGVGNPPIPSNPSSASILGLKVVGGKRVDNGRLAAIVEKVKRGSVADTIGHLRPGKPFAVLIDGRTDGQT